ncbi:uncharacterized protein MYCFIDRAFT_198351 [Pseudocercospora fijiensis CIRAD86]|uniref:Uncharacterized protein n=1 Tax=Pseudocercospora fijiensis (strain CIRAD86) TaxID=383855 RepID=M3A5V4_PSEFD|nr:uncharacterized protein MYCFIDRAFT_198351 [Pseudocercospora fijiensis CIRAD86]EME80006.1 hypothetical protein MYCFIDRAFT_198351 [Pseudocercospora fijiensis CIRAD86]
MHQSICILQAISISMYRPQPPPMDADEVEAIFESIDKKIQQSTPSNIKVRTSDIPEDDTVLSILHLHLSSMSQDREKRLSDLISRINALRSKLDDKQQPEEQIRTDRSRLLSFKEFDDLSIEQRRIYLAHVPVKVIVDLDDEIEAKRNVLGKVERDLATKE